MPTILLIRHGENDFVTTRRLAGRLPDIHLNETGRIQAEALSSRLARLPIKAVYSSPLARTIETAEPIASALNLPVIPRPGLNEIDYGAWQGKTLKQLMRRKIWRTVQRTPSLARFPEGESFAEAQLRASQEIEALAAQHKPRDMLICVSHADPIKLVVAYFLGLPLDMFQRLMVAPASITTILISEMGSHLLNLNQNLLLDLD